MNYDEFMAIESPQGCTLSEALGPSYETQLRDQFAGKALELVAPDRHDRPMGWQERAARSAYHMADEMMKARLS